jgi:hypothetical protein
MPLYMVERHLPGVTPDQLGTAASRAKNDDQPGQALSSVDVRAVRGAVILPV